MSTISPGHLIAEATDIGQTVREYVWLDDMPLAVIADVDTMSPKLWHVHADQLDRPLKMTDGTEAVVWDAVYRPFGEVVSITGSGSNNLRFPGQYFLIESGLHYNWHRHYDPTIGRYLQTDPLGFVDGPSVYAYARSAPTQYVDPDGRLAWWVLPVVFAGADFAWQLYQNNGDITCVNPWEVAEAALSGLGLNPAGLAGRAALGGEYDILLACRDLSGLREQLTCVAGSVMDIFSGVASEVDDLPIGTDRKYWAADLLTAKDLEAADYRNRVKGVVTNALQELLVELDDRDSDKIPK
jgi:RHS repeat-associated protein